MKKLNLLLPVLLALLVCQAFQSSAQNREERQVDGDFDEIEASSGINVIVKQGEDVEIVVEADPDDMDEVVTRLRGNTLKVYFDSSVFDWFTSRSAKVYVTTKNIKKLSASGGADIKSTGTIKSGRIVVSASGGADAEVTIKAREAVLNSSGGADVLAEGEVELLEAHASGGADVMARKLVAKKVVATSSGGADVEVYVTEELEASASGGADVDYYGPGSPRKISESGGGDVTGHE
ncbi:head GIN domain-containing protein [Marinilabilia rubra]|uniref:DUF2807 domain-containing protein n=1 Tax=Marinilabilia rubra TaxID=2162893 RepID=A0A2U2B4C2_9BACT|nr:head GIN domain-containing protein [Marinilabilia rubra]PWD97908.1 DUF2807 domain-containing protein [Marinilabilia rubra]